MLVPHIRRIGIFLAALFVILSGTMASAPAVYAAPNETRPLLSLPTPVGEAWTIIQGYACGTHDSWDRYSLDLVRANGKTIGASVHASADGEIMVWVPKSGTLILRHSGGIFTMYTHMSSVVSTQEGKRFKRGDVIGAAGERNTEGTPHLHFTAFTGNGEWASNRKSFPLSFVDGYDLKDIGGCSQHQGKKPIAGGPLAATDGFTFQSNLNPGIWTNQDNRIAFGGSAAARGLSIAWGSDPGGDEPELANTRGGSVNLAAAGQGLHTLFVRTWDSNGNASTKSYGPLGYDTQAPVLNSSAPIHLKAGETQELSWPAASDNAAGVLGYRIYVGSDALGTSEWFVNGPVVALDAMAAGNYVLRAQAVDAAGNRSEWATIASLVVE